MDQEFILPIPVEEDNSDLVPKGKSPYYGSLKQITNCLLINSDLDHAYNDAGIVTSSSEYAPSDLVTGIREVFVISSSIPHIAVKIHGISTSNQYKEWVRYYNGSTWTAWFGFATTDQVDTVSNRLGDPSSASAVTGNDAFSKINSLNSNITTLQGNIAISAIQSITAAANSTAQQALPLSGYTAYIIASINNGIFFTTSISGNNVEAMNRYSQELTLLYRVIGIKW